MVDKQQNSLQQEIRDVIACLRLVKANIWLVLLAALFSTLVVFINLGVIALLAPLAEGLIKQDFTQVSATIFGISLKSLPKELQTNTGLFCSILVMIYGMVLVKAMLSYALTLAVATQAEKASSSLRVLLVKQYLSFGKRFLDTTSSSIINSQINRCTSWIARQLTAFHSLATDALMLVAYIVFMLFISWQLTLSLALVLPVILFGFRKMVNYIQKLAKEHTDRMDDLNLRTSELIKRLALVQSYGTEERELAGLSSEAHIQYGLAFKFLGLHNLVAPFQEIGTTTAQLVAAFTLALVIPVSTLSPRDVFVFFYLSSKVVPLANLLNQFRVKLVVHSGSMNMLRDLLRDDDKFKVEGGNRKFDGLRDQITVNDLRFSYDDETIIFENISFSIKANSITALVGQTGAGKTTIVNLLLRLYNCPPQSILFDGVDVREYSVNSIRKGISFVDQFPVIFDDSLRANLCYGIESEMDDATIYNALQVAQLTDFVRELPDGLESHLGTRVSAGQRQRIALCRALLRDAPLLVLDEATSALDSHTEELVMRAINDNLQGKTILLTSHRLSTVKYADTVLVLENHKIVQTGSVKELSSHAGAFTRCFNIQPESIQ